MKILMICDFFQENQQYQENLLVKYYLKLGHEVTIVTSTITSVFDYYSGNYNKNIKPHEYCVNGFTIIRQPYLINILNKLRKLRGLKKIINKIKPDFIYVHVAPLNLFPAISFKNKNSNCKVVFDSHSDYSNSAKNWLSMNILHKIIYKSVLKINYKKLDKIFYITPGGAEFLNQVYRIPKTYLSLLPLGVDSDYVEEIKSKKHQMRKKLGIDEGDFVVFAGGKLNREKKIELVINSFLKIKEETCHLIIVGDTKDVKYKQMLIGLIKQNPKIHFIGWVEGQQVYDYMSVCDVAVFPASQSIMWQQAIGSGLPLIIGQTLGQDATYLNRNNNIFLIEEDLVDEENIKNILNLLIKDENLLNTMKINAIKTTEEMLCYNEIAKKSII